jgi:hypothetical protein
VFSQLLTELIFTFFQLQRQDIGLLDEVSVCLPITLSPLTAALERNAARLHHTCTAQWPVPCMALPSNDMFSFAHYPTVLGHFTICKRGSPDWVVNVQTNRSPP